MKAVNATASLVLAVFMALTAAFGIAAAVEEPPSLMSRADRMAALRTIEREGRLALAGCRQLAEPRERAVCRAQARADQRVATAALEARYRGTVHARQHVEAAQTRAARSVAIARRLVQA